MQYSGVQLKSTFPSFGQWCVSTVFCWVVLLGILTSLVVLRFSLCVVVLLLWCVVVWCVVVWCVVVVGCWLLVVGCGCCVVVVVLWLLVVGCWLLVVGCWLLVVGVGVVCEVWCCVVWCGVVLCCVCVVSWTPLPRTSTGPPKISRFFPSPAKFSFFLLLLGRSFRGILVVPSSTSRQRRWGSATPSNEEETKQHHPTEDGGEKQPPPKGGEGRQPHQKEQGKT